MTDSRTGSGPADPGPADVGAYCRAIESHLCLRNGGHRIRVIGPAFDLARAWYRAGIPLKVVERGIDHRVERAEQRGVRRPLRLEYCEADVQQAFADWRRAVGPGATALQAGDESPASESKGPSLPRHLDRVATRTSSAIVQLPAGPLRALGAATLARVESLRALAPRARGESRQAAIATLAELDEAWDAAVLAHADAALLDRGRAEATRDLAAFQGRMPEGEYRRAVDGLTAKAVREWLGVPRMVP